LIGTPVSNRKSSLIVSISVIAASTLASAIIKSARYLDKSCAIFVSNSLSSIIFLLMAFILGKYPYRFKSPFSNVPFQREVSGPWAVIVSSSTFLLMAYKESKYSLLFINP
jgi:hypothetical protein